MATSASEILRQTHALVAQGAALRAELAQTRQIARALCRRWPRQIWGGAEQGRDAALRQQVREWLTNGRLPVPGQEMWVGRGSERWCAICSATISRAHIEYEIPKGDGWLYVHLGCYNLWKEEAALLHRQPPAADAAS